MEKKNNKNALVLVGDVTKEPTQIYASNYYEFELSVKRHSGVFDVIRVMYNSELISPETVNSIKIGQKACVTGRVIVYYDKHKSMVRAIADQILIGELGDYPEYLNEVYFEGFVSQDPICRVTPKGRQVADIIVSTMYNDHVSYVPCIVWGAGTKIAKKTKHHDFATVNGRFQSREYNKELEDGTVEVRTAYEISAFDLDIVDIHPSVFNQLR